jgi:NAD-dependent SIR2 family protein deacetylase
MKTKPKLEKTVYIIGAGFSAPAGGPDQGRLMERILNLHDSDAKTKDAKTALEDFLVGVMNVAPSNKSEVSLEDIYTPIDRCLADGVSLRDRTPTQLQVLRGQMEYLISVAIDNSFDVKASEDPSCSNYVHSFAKHLVEVASLRAKKAKGAPSATAAKAYDPFSVISLNWDILFDKAIYKALSMKDGGSEGDYDPIGVVDYCCYISSIEAEERRIRSGLWALGARGYNVKLLKIHGSMNWLQCSNCQRLFVSFDEKVNIPNFINAHLCRHCSNCGVNAMLQGSLVMPTFLKDLSNFQIKLVWQNAAVELMEADRLVFIGYSLPHADFEFRQLLSRMVRKDAEIDVILFHDGKPEGMRKYEEECKRYRQFFGTRKVTTKHDGVAAFVKRLTTTAVR